MTAKVERAVAVVGVGAVLPDAPDAASYWDNLQAGRYSISEVPRERWNPDFYYDADPKAEDKTYSTIGGWVRDFDWAPLDWRLPIPPKVAEAMDLTQKWSVMACREALHDFGYPQRPLDGDRTAVVLGNAMAGDLHYLTALRIYFPEYADELSQAPSFQSLSPGVQEAIVSEMHAGVRRRFPHITEDTMPGELGNIIAGRVANLFNFHGPNFVVDAACASALAAIDAAIEGLEQGDYDAVLTGGVDANMGAPSFIKFCKIGALSPSGTRPYHEGADGFVMGEGAAVFLLKRLEDAERDGDKIYGVIRGIGGSSDGKGKGITAPNPVGQEFAIARAWRNANLSPNEATYIEGHGTSTRVGDVVEVTSLGKVFSDLGLAPGTIPLGSVKSNIGHLKSSAGAAGMLKAVLALHHKRIPPSLGETGPNPNIDFADSPLFINKELREWEVPADQVRTAGISAFGFGGTNFHVVLEEYVPGRLQVGNGSQPAVAVPQSQPQVSGDRLKDPMRGALVIGADSRDELVARLESIVHGAGQGTAPETAPPAEAELRAPTRIAIDFGDAAELAAKGEKALKALQADNDAMWKPLRNQGVYFGEGSPQLVAFLYTGQGSQYVNMLDTLRTSEPIVAAVLARADDVMEPMLGAPLSDFMYADTQDEEAMKAATDTLRQTEITQPAVLTVDAALTDLLAAYGIRPDMVMGHSLGEYGALVASNALPFEDALEAVAGRGREMSHIEVEDNGLMAAVFAPLDQIQQVVDEVDDYVVIANINSYQQAVLGGSTPGVTAASERLAAAGAQVVPLPVSHAFHTEIVEPASDPLQQILRRLRLASPAIPLVANVDGEFYPMGPNVSEKMIDILGKQISSPVQFVKGLQTLYEAGCRVFVEVGPKKALAGLVDDVFADTPDVFSAYTNHPKHGDVISFNHALCALYAAGHGIGSTPEPAARPTTASTPPAMHATAPVAAAPPATAQVAGTSLAGGDDMYRELGHVFADFLAKGYEIYSQGQGIGAGPDAPYSERPVVVTGAGLGLPGGKRVFGDDKISGLLHGEQLIDVIPAPFRQKVADKHINRLVKSEAGGGHFETINSQSDVIKLAGRSGEIDLVEEFGFPADRIAALDRTTMLAIGAGIDALRDAGIPLVMRYKDTTTGTKLPERWMLPEAYRDTTGVIFASAFPGMDTTLQEVESFYEAEMLKQRLADYKTLQAKLADLGGTPLLAEELQHRIHEIEHQLETDDYEFNRRFLFRTLSMGHSQMAEYVGARGPNTQINAACASTTQAVALAEDWIRTGRCERVLVVAGDDITTDNMIEWFASGFLAVGAAATDEIVDEAALPFDRRRHGMIIGMGAAALVIEHPDSAAGRGIRPITEVLATNTANSAFHGSRLDPSHIREVMEDLIATAEERWGIDRHEIAPRTVFVSHETYTPARGGSAQAEVDSLRHVFGAAADSIVVANTKGYTGHAMGAGVEDVLAIKSLETGLVPAVPNFKEPDPELGSLNLSRGGLYPIAYALRLGAGFGSQVSMTLYRHVPAPTGIHPEPDELGFETRIEDERRWQQWLADVTGLDAPRIEVEKRTLRVSDDGPPLRQPIRPERVAAAASQPYAELRSAQTAAAEPSAPSAPEPELAPASAAAQPVPPATMEPATAPAEPAASADAGIATKVLEIVAAQTGYPPDMLDLDLDLEADLGVDTVKQAETFAAIREEYDIERDDNLALRDYPTLHHVIGFVEERLPESQQQPAARAAVEPADDEAVAPTTHSEDGEDTVVAKVLEIVANQTGYPTDMLELDADLEADLGIDTVKQAETIAAIREEYGIERDDNLALRDYPTLQHVVGFVHERGRTEGAGQAAAATEPAPTAPVAADAIQGDDEAAAAIPRRIPTPVLRPALDMCRDTGVVLGEGSRVIVASDAGGVGAALIKRLESESVEVMAVDPAAEPADLRAAVTGFAAAGPVTGVYWLTALDVEPTIREMDLAGWRSALRTRIKSLYETMRTLYSEVGAAGTFLVTATRLGGMHGYGAEGATAPLGGSVTGFTKAYKREKPEALVKAVDFAPSRKTAALADLLLAETARDPGAVEIGYAADRRWTITLREEELAADGVGLTLDSDSVFVVTGAAGSIVSAITADLAAASGGTFHLLDLIPEPDASDPDLAAYASDRDGLKRTIFERLKESGERATPAEVERRLAAIERSHAALSAIRAVEAAGGTAFYHCADLRDGAAVASAMEHVTEVSGKVDVLLHAGGLEISRRLPDKEPDQFNLVFDVKADGWFNLIAGLGDTPIAASVVFSSVAGRFGNDGQTDYSAANDLLCKLAAAERASADGTMAIAIDWTAWGDIGMATRGSIPTIMAAAGIDMLPAAAGIPIVRREVTGRSVGGELVAGLRLGVLVDEFDASGGLDPTAIDTSDRPLMAGAIEGFTLYDGLVVETELDPAQQPFLFDHRIDGTPVLPGVMGVEAFAAAATLPYPDLSLVAVEDIDFLAPFKFYRDEPRTLRVEVQFTSEGDQVVGNCRLIGERMLTGQDEPQRTIHFTGKVRLGGEAPPLAGATIPGNAQAAVHAEQIYEIYFHGPAYQVAGGIWSENGVVAGAFAPEAPANSFPVDARLVTAPRLTELAFQTAGVWEIGTTGVMALPAHIDRVEYVPGAAEAGATAVVTPGEDGFAATVVDANGAGLARLTGYRTVALPAPVAEGAAAPLRTAMGQG